MATAYAAACAGHAVSAERANDMESTKSVTLPLAGLERVYDCLAEAIDRAGSDHSERFLVKLALLQAYQLGDAEAVERLIQQALADLD